MAGSPFFSVIIATRNRPGPVVVALRAVQRQTFSDFEVIVLDDGSTAENLGQLRDEWGQFDERFRLMELSPAGGTGSGPSIARNRGMEMATGEFATFCDDDDEWCDVRHLEVAEAALRAHPDADMYYANQVAMRDGVVTNPNWFKNLCALTAGRSQAAADNVVVITTGDVNRSNEYVSMNSLVIRRSFALGIGGFWERLQYWEDGNFFLRALDRARKILFRSDVIVNHYIGNVAARATASSKLEPDEKLLVTALACKHVRSVARDPHVLSFARRQEGDCLRRVAMHLAGNGSPEAATFAWQALGARFGLKWFGYSVWLLVRRLGR